MVFKTDKRQNRKLLVMFSEEILTSKRSMYEVKKMNFLLVGQAEGQIKTVGSGAESGFRCHICQL